MFNVNFRLLKTIYVHLLVFYLNKLRLRFISYVYKLWRQIFFYSIEKLNIYMTGIQGQSPFSAYPANVENMASSK